MNSSWLLRVTLIGLALSAGCRRTPLMSPAPTAGPLTRAERSGYTETSSYKDVLAFLDSLRGTGAPLSFGTMHQTNEMRDLKYVIASRPVVNTPSEAAATGKPVVYVQANIHAGEVEGKEALLALLRDLSRAPAPNVLDSIVLIAVPIYNADGNERWASQETQRSEQNGPARVGQRPNAQNLDLNRDYIKAEAPETQASLEMFSAWDPAVFVDLHTTDGSYHGYALTYSPSLHPSAPLGDYSRVMLAELRRRVRERDGFETFDYGNFYDGGREVSTDSVHSGWYTYDSHPRFGTNYMGLRGRVSVLSEAFSHDPFERRVKSTYAFVRELLSLTAERAAELRALEARADAEIVSGARPMIALRSALPATAPSVPVRYEILERTGDSTRTQAGVPRGLRRTGRIVTRSMPVFDRFVPALSVTIPDAYWFTDSSVARRLQLHGVRVDSVGTTRAARVQRFVVDSVVKAPRPFQGHNEVRLTGLWSDAGAMPAGGYLVSTHQRLGRVAAYLLEPESDDSFATWNAFDSVIAPGRPYPVLRVWTP